jgi:hypothetical protein
MSPYVRNVVVLMYFTKRSRIEVFDREIELSDWPKISENQGARTTACTAAAERIERKLVEALIIKITGISSIGIYYNFR